MIILKRWAEKTPVGLSLSLGVFLFYVFNLPPAVLWGDNARLAMLAKNFKFNAIMDYPLHTLTGKIFSYLILFGNFYYRQGIRVAFFAAVTVLILYHIILKITSSRTVSVVVALVWAVSHTFWLLAEMNEAYILALFFIAVEMFFLLKWFESNKEINLYLSFFFFGMGLLAHRVVAFCFPGFFYLFLSKKDPIKKKLRQFFFIGIFLITGAFPIVYNFFLKAGANVGESSSGFGFVKNIFPETFLITPATLLPRLIKYPVWLIYQFPGFSFLIGLFGIWSVFKEKEKRDIFLALFINTFFYVFVASIYALQRIFFILLPTYFFFAIFVARGLDEFIKKFSEKKFFKNAVLISMVLLPPLAYFLTPDILNLVGIKVDFIRKLAYRDSARYYLFPVFQEAKANSVIMTDFNPGIVLQYFQKVKNMRRDVFIDMFIDGIVHHSKDRADDIIKKIKEKMGERPLYLGDTYEPYYCTLQLKKHFKLIPLKALTEIIPRR